MKKGVCYGISVGPGQEGQITLEAIEIIKKSDIVFLPSFPKEECKAYQVIKKTFPEIDNKDIKCETFTMSKDATVMSNRHDEIAKNVMKELDAGKTLCFLTLGEVALYSTYLYIHLRLIEKDYESILIAGISSVQAIADYLGKPLAIGADEVHIFPNSKNIDSKLLLPGTKVFMKPKGSFEEFIDSINRFIEVNPGTEAFGISNFGMPDQKVAKSVHELGNLAGYFTVVFVVGDNEEYMPSSRFYENRACEYYPCHKNIEHMNCLFCYCPMYRCENCLGNPTYIEKNGKPLKVCTYCTFPHEKNHYDAIMEFLKNQ